MLHALLVLFLPAARDSERTKLNERMLQQGWDQYTVPFTWTKAIAQDDEEAVQRTMALDIAPDADAARELCCQEVQDALLDAGSPTYQLLLQVGDAPAVSDPPGWDRLA